MDINKNPSIGSLFGRMYVANSGPGGTAFGAPTFKGQGLYALNIDQSDALGYGTNAQATALFAPGGQASPGGPWQLRVNADGTVLVGDDSPANSGLWQFSTDLLSHIQVLAGVGDAASVPAGIHGRQFGTPLMTGSLAAGNLVLYTGDDTLGVPSDTNCIKGPLTSPGSYNCVFQYNIGAGPLPWNKRPDYGYTMGLDGIATLRTDIELGKDGKIICGFGRANGSNPDLQILRPFTTTNGPGDNVDAIEFKARDVTNWVYTSGVTPPFNSPPPSGDPWNGVNAGGAVGTYAGVRVSPDGLFLASVDINCGITIANLTNGVPNDGTIFGIANPPSASTPRGMCWDAADNIWVNSQVAGNFMRCYSLGLSTTCTTSNDWTGTNGSFQFVLPPTAASVAATTPTASQNYVNNSVNAGTPTPGVFRITLNSSDTTTLGPTTVGFALSGSGNYTNNYTINTNETPNGVTVRPNSVTFPAGMFTGSNGPNWNVDVKVTPTAIPVSGPTLTVNMRLNSGSNYFAAVPLNGSIAILNTGPQLIQLSAAAIGGNMNRGIAHDYAKFVITRLGDTNGPGNDAVNPITARALTVTNVNYFGTAQYPLDYTAQAQKFIGAAPVDGASGIVVSPGQVTVTGMIGNPVKHTNPNIRATNLTVIINLTNGYTCPAGFSNNCASGQCCTNVAGLATNSLLSSEGLGYIVNTTTLTLNEFDNAVGGEVVLWSNPLTNALDSTNWTAVFANINLGSSPALATVISNYPNDHVGNGNPPEGFTAAFGKTVLDPGNDGGINVPQSANMIANGWTNALKVSVNKYSPNSAEAGINLYPASGTNQGLVFNGNYALRFDMYLSLYDFGSNDPTIGTPAREFAAFGVNHFATNANWRLDINPRADGTGARPINADGEWCCINAASGSITPADYDMFISPAFVVPIYDTSGTNVLGMVNTNGQTFAFTTNKFIFTPFTNAYQAAPGSYTGVTNVFGNNGVPNDQQSVNNNAIGGSVQNGIIKDPPFSGINSLGGAPDYNWVDVSLEVNQQTNLTLKVARQTIFNSSTTVPVFGTANPIAPIGGTPMLGYLDPNQDVSDYSAFVYYSNMRVVEISPFIYKHTALASNPSGSALIYPDGAGNPISVIVTQGSSLTLTGAACFATAPMSNVWYRGTGIVGNPAPGAPTFALATNLAGVSATNMADSLTVTFSTAANASLYMSVFSDPAGSVTSRVAAVEVVFGPTNKSGIVGANTFFLVNSQGPAAPTIFQWYTNTVNNFSTAKKMVNNTHNGGVTTAAVGITNVANSDAALFYWCAVTNAGGGVIAGPAILTIGANTATVSPAATNAPWGSPVTFTVTASGTAPFTYQWKRGGNNLSNGGNISGADTSAMTLGSITTADGGAANSYTAGVTNSAGGTISSAGILTVSVPPPTITLVTFTTTNIGLSFTSTNSFDTTNAFLLLNSEVVTGPYTTNTSATYTFSGGVFQVNTTNTGSSSNMFYRLQHVP
jgi:hypothetical protein